MSNFDINWFSLISDYGGVILGVVFLFIASSFLPGKIRKYVLTAGITLLVYRVYQIYSARKELEEADKIREQLRGESKELKEQLAGLQQEADALRVKKTEIEAERDRLKAKSDALDTSSATAIEEKKKLDQEAEKLLQEGQELQTRSERQENALSTAAELAARFAVN